MKTPLTIILTAVTLFILPFTAPAMDSGQMAGMSMDADTVMLPGKTVDGVRAMAHLRDIRAAMAKMNMSQTHHFMVMFTDAETGKSLDSGLAAVKITDPQGTTSTPVKLMGMKGGFGADVTLDKPGIYTFDVATRFADGKKRQFQFHSPVKN